MDLNDSTPSINLIGLIHHTIPRIDGNHGRKRPSPNGEHDNNAVNKRNDMGKGNQRLLSGFTFRLHSVEQVGSHGQVSARNSDLAENAEVSLVIPLTLLKIACHAVATHQLVKLTQFSVIRYRENRGEIICGQKGIMRGVEINVFKTIKTYFSTQSHEIGEINKEHRNDLIIIEIHRNGLTLEPITGQNSFNPIINETERNTSILSLKTLSQKEHQHYSSASKTGKNTGKKSSLGKQPMDITGVVDAISPVLVNRANDEPFAIIELYQPNPCESTDATIEENGDPDSVYTAVAVIRGEKALCMHAAIQPGQSITLSGVISRKWKLPDDFRKSLNDQNSSNKRSRELYRRLRDRVPDRVILVSDPSSIRWNENDVEDTTIPSTIESLHCAQGIVESINFHCLNSERGRKLDNVIHFVTLKLLHPMPQTTLKKDLRTNSSNYTINKDSTAKKLRIYFQRHVLCPNLILGIQPGAMLRALNIHKCEKFCYMACLRSTVTIECCAGENSFSQSFSHPRLLCPAKPFFLVPEHRISIVEQHANSVSSSQCIWEDEFKSDLKTKWSNIAQIQANGRAEAHLHQTNSSAFDTAVCALLEHCNGIGDEKETRLTINTNSKDCSTQIRDPYAEFFDHAHDCTVLSDDGCGNSTHISLQNGGQFRNNPSFSIPVVRGVNELWNSCSQDFIRRVQSYVEQYTSAISSRTTNASRSMSGWTCSHHYAGVELFDLLRDLSKAENTPKHAAQKIYSWGDFEWDHNAKSSIPSFIRSGNRRIPVSFSRPSKSAINESLHNCNNPVFSSGWLQIESVIVSAVCLGVRTPDANVEKKNHDVNKIGGIFPDEELVFVANDLIFIATIHFTAAEVASFSPMINSINTSKRRRLSTGFVEMESCDVGGDPLRSSNFIGIQECLEHDMSDEIHDEESFLLGLLIRQRFKFRRPKRSFISSSSKGNIVEKSYEGWTITLSHISSPETGLTSAATLQTIEVQISIPIPVDEYEFDINCTINRCGTIRPDQVTMGQAWKAAAGIRNILPILSGGWDECNNQLHEGNKLSTPYLPFVYVKIPLSSRSFSKLGYQRFKCRLHEVESYFVIESNDPGHMESHPSRFLPSNTKFPGLKFCPRVEKFLPGMRNRRIRNFGSSGSATNCNDSSFLRIKFGGGVPSASLADLHWEMCKALKHGTNSTLRPSLLRRVHNIKMLGISFCRARAECTQCFQFLTRGHDSREKMDPFVTRDSSHLFCPSGCSTSFASVKWECSAIVDDGSGQAKLYAEREAALLLLGNGLLVNDIETGAMESPSGILFQATLPISVNLMQSIKTVTSTLKNLKNSEKHMILNKDCRSMHDFLPPNAKAEYLMQYHCRRWHQRYFHLSTDILCRCKPLSADITSVNRSEIPVAHAWISKVGIDFGSALTFTLPPLKLTLEEVCMGGEGIEYDVWQGWDTLKRLM